MIPAFLRIRARPDEQEDIRWEFENVTFILNIIDVLSGDTDYINIRKRKPLYATLQVVESRVEEAKDREFTERAKFQAKYRQGTEGSGSTKRRDTGEIPGDGSRPAEEAERRRTDSTKRNCARKYSG